MILSYQPILVPLKSTDFILHFIFILFIFSSQFLIAQDQNRLFDSEEVLEIEISVSVKKLRSDTNASTFITQIFAVKENGTWGHHPFEIRTRRIVQFDNCYYSSTRIRMVKDDVERSIFFRDSEAEIGSSLLQSEKFRKLC